MDQPSDHLLRTLASVPVEQRILDVRCGHGTRTGHLLHLGFDVYACDPSPEAVSLARERLSSMLDMSELEKRVTTARGDAMGYADEYFDWVVAYDALERYGSRDGMLEALAEIRRVLKSGGWVYLTVRAVPEDAMRPIDSSYAGDSAPSPTFTPRSLNALMAEAGFAEAEEAVVVTEQGRRIVRSIYSKTPPPGAPE